MGTTSSDEPSRMSYYFEDTVGYSWGIGEEDCFQSNSLTALQAELNLAWEEQGDMPEHHSYTAIRSGTCMGAPPFNGTPLANYPGYTISQLQSWPSGVYPYSTASVTEYSAAFSPG